MTTNTVLVVEDDPFLRIVDILLNPNASAERISAFTDFFAHDEPDFAGYVARVRGRVGKLYPSEIRMVATEAEMRAALPGARGLIVEVAEGRARRPCARTWTRHRAEIRSAATQYRPGRVRGARVKLLTLRRRANIACCEMAFALMFTLAKKLNRVLNKISVEQLTAAGYPYKPFDRHHTPNSNWARIPAFACSTQSTIGIIGLGEIGSEVAIRAAACGARTLYYQRTRMSESEERALSVSYVPLDRLLAESDWVVPCLPGSPSTDGLIGRAQLAQMKPGAMLVNITRANIVDRKALIETLKSGRLGGFALDPLYDGTASRSDDELLSFPNVVFSPHIAAQPRFNALTDLSEMCDGIAKALA